MCFAKKIISVEMFNISLARRINLEYYISSYLCNKIQLVFSESFLVPYLNMLNNVVTFYQRCEHII